jgi:hypothetical protein
MVRVDKDGYSMAHVVKTTVQSRRDLLKAAAELRKVGKPGCDEQAGAMEQLAKSMDIPVVDEGNES